MKRLFTAIQRAISVFFTSLNMTKFKVEALNVYTSTEWLADGKKKYRSVFDKQEVDYIYAELSFLALGLTADTKAEITLEAKRYIDTKHPETLICTIDRPDYKISYNAMNYLRDGWGHPEKGEFWTEGTYYWIAYINHVLYARNTFYIYDVGKVTTSNNPYFSLNSIKLFEGSDKRENEPEKSYYTDFEAKETRYVWGEVEIENKLNRAWYCELFFYFYNSNFQFKGKTKELFYIAADKNEIQICSGWGSDTKGTWYEGDYTLMIVFMDTIVGYTHFKVGSVSKEGFQPFKTYIDNETLISAKKDAQSNVEENNEQ